jgi:site-specific recombinase XerD
MTWEASEALLAQFEEYLVVTKLSPLTVVNYLADVRDLVRWGIRQVKQDFSLIELTPNTIRAYRSYLLDEKQYAVSTINRHLQALRKFCGFAVQRGFMRLDPTEGVQLVQSAGNVPVVPLSTSEVEALLETTGSQQPSLARRDSAILMLLLHTGLRVNELVALRLDDVQFDHPGTRLMVKDGRGGETRRIPLESQVCHALSEYLSSRPDVAGETHLFLSREGRPLSARSVQRIVSSSARAAGLEGVSAQLLRRTYANHLLARTGDLALVSRRLGHQSLAATTRYIADSADP